MLEGLIDIIKGALKVLIKWLLSPVYKAVKSVFCWLFLWALDIVELVLPWLIPMVPLSSENWSKGTEVFCWINQWVPVAEMLALVVANYALYATIAAYRFLKSFIPTLGG